jgi:hypothetical protein
VTPRADRLRYLTVVTYGRTGSTALQAALNALPGVLVRGENYGALRGLHDYVQALAETADRHHASGPAHPWFGSRGLRLDDVLAGLREQVCATLLRPRRDTRWTGFKEVRYEPGHFADADELLDYLLFLDALLPGIAYVVNVRSAERVATSGWWPDHNDPLPVLRETRARLEGVSAELAELLGPGRVLLLDHDVWSADPQVLVDGFHRLGLPRDDDAVRRAWATRLGHGPRDDVGPGA